MAPQQDAQLAQQLADTFAQTYNQQQQGRVQDWQGLIKLEELGIETLPGYIGHTGG